MDQAKPTLEGMPLEIQVEILRHLLRRDYPIKLCPLDSKSKQSWDFGSLGILGASKHLSDLSLGILYGENSFRLPKKVYTMQGSLELHPSLCPLRDALDLSRWSTLKNMPRDTTWYASSMDCLDLISQTRPGQERLRSVSIEMSYHMIMLFMIGLIPQILKRLRALQSLKFIVKKKAWTWASFDSCTPGKGKANHVFDREFLLLIKSQLGHITTINTTSFGEAENADEGPCPWVAEQLEKRNRAWTPRIARENQFVRTACAMTAMNPVVFRNVSDTEYAWRRIRPLYRNSDGKIPLIPDEPRDVFH